jgi:glucokinase
VLFVAIGTGIAAALVMGGAGYSGAHGAAGEIGHLVVRPGGTPCGCGGSGCLEAEASARAIGRRYAEVSGIADATALDVVTRAAQDEDLAVRIWRDSIDALADGLVAAQAFYDVNALVVGGGLAEAGDALLVPLRSAFQQRITFHRLPMIVRAALGPDAGCIGAAVLALDQLALDHAARSRRTPGVPVSPPGDVG